MKKPRLISTNIPVFQDDTAFKLQENLRSSDINNLSRVCRHFRVICKSNALWKQIYSNHCSNVSEEIEQLGNEIGWKKTFFTNKLQLQKKASRLRRSAQKKTDDSINISDEKKPIMVEL